MSFKKFRVLKVPMKKKYVEHSETERVKPLSTNLRSRNFVVDIWTVQAAW